MRSRLLSEVASKQRIRVLRDLFREGDSTVSELSERMRMSYMGVKKHCVDLQREGYLETGRRPKPLGRPELLYRLTPKALALFVPESQSLALRLLAGASRLFGTTAPSKLLFLHFEELQAAYQSRLRGETPEDRARNLARLREVDGWISRFEPHPPCLAERNSPYTDLIDAYPLVERLETEMIARLLGVPIRRQNDPTTSTTRFCFQTDTKRGLPKS